MNQLSLKFELEDRDFSSLLGEFTIRVDGGITGGSFPGEGAFPLVVPNTNPVTLLVDDRACVEDCCPGLWVTARRSGNTVIWSDFHSGEPSESDPPPETEYVFSIEDYHAQIESAKSDLQEVEHLRACPPFEELIEKLHPRMASVNLHPPIDWLLAENLIRNKDEKWIRCCEGVFHTEVAKEHYVTLREWGHWIEITLARHPCFDGTLALLQGRPISNGPSLSLAFVRHTKIAEPVHSLTQWAHLRERFGINRPQPGISDFNLPQ